MTEQALTELVQKTFDGVQKINGKVDTLLTKHDGLEARHNALEVHHTALVLDHNALKIEVATIKAGMTTKLAGATGAGGIVGYIIQALAGGIIVALVAGCSWPPTPEPDHAPPLPPCDADSGHSGDAGAGFGVRLGSLELICGLTGCKIRVAGDVINPDCAPPFEIDPQ